MDVQRRLEVDGRLLDVAEASVEATRIEAATPGLRAVTPARHARRRQ